MEGAKTKSSIMPKYRAAMKLSDEEKKPVMAELMAENDAHRAESLPEWMTLWNEKLEASSSGFLVGESCTIADLQLFCETSGLAAGGRMSAYDLSPYPAILAHRKLIASLPAIVAYFEKAPKEGREALSNPQ